MNPAVIKDDQGLFSPEFKKASDALRNRLAQKRKLIWDIVSWDNTELTPSITPTVPLVSEIIDAAPPSMDLGEKGYSMQNNIQSKQSKKFLPVDILVDHAWVRTWKEFVADVYSRGGLNDPEAVHVPSAQGIADTVPLGDGTHGNKGIAHLEIVDMLPDGEVLNLAIAGFEIFSILQMYPNADHTVGDCVIEFKTTGSLKEETGNYLISLPLMEGSSFSILRKKTMEPYISHEIQNITHFKPETPLVKKLLDIFM